MALTIRSAQTIRGGLTLKGSRPLPSPVLYLDAGNNSSYPGSGTTWTDLVGSKTFTLNGSPSYSSANGGYLQFNPGTGDFAECSTSLPSSLASWTVETWHYYDGTNTGQDPCIVTEIYTGGAINYTLGSSNGSAASLQSGFFNGSWQSTTPSYSLTPGQWYHIVATFDGSASIKLYVNGNLAQHATTAGSSNSSGSGIRLMRRWDLSDYWGGKLAIVRIYDQDITQTGVSDWFNTERTRFGI